METLRRPYFSGWPRVCRPTAGRLHTPSTMIRNATIDRLYDGRMARRRTQALLDSINRTLRLHHSSI